MADSSNVLDRISYRIVRCLQLAASIGLADQRRKKMGERIEAPPGHGVVPGVTFSLTGNGYHAVAKNLDRFGVDMGYIYGEALGPDDQKFNHPTLEDALILLERDLEDRHRIAVESLALLGTRVKLDERKEFDEFLKRLRVADVDVDFVQVGEP